MIKYCDICHSGIAEYKIEDLRSDMEKINQNPMECSGDVNYCEHCFKKFQPKEIKWYENLKKFYYESGRRIAKKYLKWTNARKN